MADPTELEVRGLIEGGSARHDYGACARLPERHQVEDVGLLVPGRHGRAVTLKGLLELCPPLRGARYLNVASLDTSFAVSVTLEEVAEALVVYELNGAPLSPSKGGPFRLLVPGHPDECVNVKQVAVFELAESPGRDTRPTDDAEHEALHRAASSKKKS